MNGIELFKYQTYSISIPLKKVCILVGTGRDYYIAKVEAQEGDGNTERGPGIFPEGSLSSHPIKQPTQVTHHSFLYPPLKTVVSGVYTLVVVQPKTSSRSFTTKISEGPKL